MVTLKDIDTAVLGETLTEAGRQPAFSGIAGPSGKIPAVLQPTDTFVRRHIGPSDDEVREMLATLGLSSLDELTDATVPEAIRLRQPLKLANPADAEALLGVEEYLKRTGH